MKVLIIGCGWLGLPLAERMIQEGHQVFGSSTRENKLQLLAQSGITPFLYNGDTFADLPEWIKEIDCVILNFPPSKTQDYPKQIERLIEQLPTACKIIFTSSTGVYQDVEGEVDEQGVVQKDHSVYLAEEKIKNSNKKFTILRLAGLIGGDRHPVKYMSGKTYQDGNALVNLVHREDVIQAIIAVIEQDKWQKVFNICHNDHPSRVEYYTQKAIEFNILKPNFILSDKKGKKINGNGIQNELNFSYTNPL